MATAICPGSFDPVTNGHLDVFARAARLFEHVTVGVLINKKKSSLFTVEERMEMLRESLRDYPNVGVESFHGLLVDYCRDNGISAIVKGLRAVSDFDYELQMAQMNYRLAGIDTLFVSTNPVYGYLSSSLVKDVATYGGDIAGLVPDTVLNQLHDKLGHS
jgi:pantetheine-phosphate adenylyltransferase